MKWTFQILVDLDDKEWGIDREKRDNKGKKKNTFSLFNILKLSDENVAIEIIYHAFFFFFFFLAFFMLIPMAQLIKEMINW